MSFMSVSRQVLHSHARPCKTVTSRVTARALSTGTSLQNTRGVDSNVLVDHRLAYLAREAFKAYDTPVTLNSGSPQKLETDKTQGIFYLAGTKVGDGLLESMTGVLAVRVVGGTALPSKDGADDKKESARYVEILNGLSVASTYPVKGKSELSFNENHKLLMDLDDPGSSPSFTLKLIHEGFVVSDAAFEKETFFTHVGNFFNRAIDDVLAEEVVSLSSDDINALKASKTLSKSIPLKSSRKGKGSINVELSYKSFDDADGPKRDDWKVAEPDFGLVTDPAEVKARETWNTLVAETAAAEQVEPYALSRVAYMDHVESDTQVWFLRCIQTKQVVVAFRGTTGYMDFRVDFDNAWKEVKLPKCDPVKIHSGFLGSWLAVDSNVCTLVDACIPHGEEKQWRVNIVGHSLGGSLASVCAYHLAALRPEYEVSMVTVASPRTGNKAFARTWQKTPDDFNIIEPVRVFNANDIVPKYPFLRAKALPSLAWLNPFKPPEPTSADDQYNHTMCTSLKLQFVKEPKEDVIAERIVQGDEKPGLADNYINVVLELGKNPKQLDEHIFNYPQMLYKAFKKQSVKPSIMN